MLEASAQENEARRQAVAVQREAVEVSRREMELKREGFELEKTRTAATIATKRLKAGDTSVSWLEAFEEAKRLLGVSVSSPDIDTRSRSVSIPLE